MFTAFGVASRLSRNSGNVTQSHGSPGASTRGDRLERVIDSMAGSRSSGATGAKPNPQLPIATEVMPCQPEIVQYGSQKTWAS